VFPVSKFEANGLRQNEFCRNHGLALSAWQRQLKRRGQRRCKGEGRFVAVELAGMEPNGCFHRDDARQNHGSQFKYRSKIVNVANLSRDKFSDDYRKSVLRKTLCGPKVQTLPLPFHISGRPNLDSEK